MFIIDAKFHHGSTWYGALFNLGYTESALFQFSYVEKPCVCGAVKKPLPSTFRVVCGLAVSLFSFFSTGLEELRLKTELRQHPNPGRYIDSG